MVKRLVILLCFFSFVIPIKAAKNHPELQINENLLKSTKKNLSRSTIKQLFFYGAKKNIIKNIKLRFQKFVLINLIVKR